jgi:hypothetical protein
MKPNKIEMKESLNAQELHNIIMQSRIHECQEKWENRFQKLIFTFKMLKVFLIVWFTITILSVLWMLAVILSSVV